MKGKFYINLNGTLMINNPIKIEKLPTINFFTLFYKNTIINNNILYINDSSKHLKEFICFLHYYTYGIVYYNFDKIPLNEFILLCNYYMIMSDNESFRFLNTILSEWKLKNEKEDEALKYHFLFSLSFIVFYLILSNYYILKNIIIFLTVSFTFQSFLYVTIKSSSEGGNKTLMYYISCTFSFVIFNMVLGNHYILKYFMIFLIFSSIIQFFLYILLTITSIFYLSMERRVNMDIVQLEQVLNQMEVYLFF